MQGPQLGCFLLVKAAPPAAVVLPDFLGLLSRWGSLCGKLAGEAPR